jgi:hypothetical protein
MITKVKPSRYFTYDEGHNASADEGHLYLTSLCCLVLNSKHLRTSPQHDNLKAKIEKLSICKASTSTVENVTICTRCRDVNIGAIDDHLAIIKQQNDHIAKLTAKIAEHELENGNFKFARSMLYNGRHPGIKDGIGFQQGSQSVTL